MNVICAFWLKFQLLVYNIHVEPGYDVPVDVSLIGQ